MGFTFGSKLQLVRTSAAIELFRRACIRDVYAFAYTNAWIYLTAAVSGGVQEANGLKRNKSMIPMLAFLAGAIVPFAEGILCNSGFKDMGGHAIFDFVIGFGVLLQVATDPMNADKGKLQ